jgi:cadmium resistance protein CadD (predicted permease)
VTFANGGDNIGVYVPVFTITNTAGLITYCAAFLLMVGIWCALGLVSRADRWSRARCRTLVTSCYLSC